MTVSEYEACLATGASPSVIAAVDILTDDGVGLEKACELAVTAERTGRNAEAFARHFVKLRAALR